MPLNDPIPSTAADVLKYNVERFDEVVTSDTPTYTDRLGRERLTVAGIEAEANAAIAQIESYANATIAQIEAEGEAAIDALRIVSVGSFEDGGTITVRPEVLFYDAEKTYYRWDGALPKVVPAGSTPAGTGGIGDGAWVNVGQAELRSELANPNKGAAMVGYEDQSGLTISVEDGLISRMPTVPGVSALRDFNAPRVARVWLSYHTTEGDGGHGSFRYVSGAASGTYADNGGTVIVPTGGDGSAAWVREYSGPVNVCWFGVKADGSGSSSAAIDAAYAASGGAGGSFEFSAGTYAVDAPLQIGGGFTGNGQLSELRVSVGPDDTGITLYNQSGRRFGLIRDVLITNVSDCDRVMFVNTPRTVIENARVTSTSATVSSGIIQVTDSWITTLKDVVCFSSQDVVGLYVTGSNGGLRVVGGEYATAGSPIVLDGTASVKVETVVEGTAAEDPDRVHGLEINNSRDIYVDSYFEQKGVRITGNSRNVEINGRFITYEGRIEVLGGDSIRIGRCLFTTPGTPRNAIIIGEGLDHKVSISKELSFVEDGAEQYHCVLSSSIVDADYVGENYLENPYLNKWTEGVLDDIIVTPVRFNISQEQVIVQTGTSSLRATVSSVTGDNSHLIFETSEDALEELKGHWVTFGVWVYLPTTNSQMAYVLIPDQSMIDGGGPPSTAAFRAIDDKFVFLSNSIFVHPDNTAIRFTLRAVGDRVTTDYIVVDRVGLVRGRYNRNVPFHI